MLSILTQISAERSLCYLSYLANIVITVSLLILRASLTESWLERAREV